MIDLSAHSMAVFQHGAVLCRQAQAAGMTLDELLVALEQAMPTAAPAAVPVKTSPLPYSAGTKRGRKCPTPGCSGTLTFWPQSSREAGCNVFGCLSCRYSTMETR